MDFSRNTPAFAQSSKKNFVHQWNGNFFFDCPGHVPCPVLFGIPLLCQKIQTFIRNLQFYFFWKQAGRNYVRLFFYNVEYDFPVQMSKRNYRIKAVSKFRRKFLFNRFFDCRRISKKVVFRRSRKTYGRFFHVPCAGVAS